MKEIEARYKLENWGEQIKEYVRTVGLVDDERSYSRSISAFKVAAVVCHSHLSVLKKREACELLLWGVAEPNTLEEITFFEARLKHLPDITRRALQREAEEKRRKDEERKLEAAEREAARLARSAPAPPADQSAPSAAASDFWHSQPDEESEKQRVLTKYSSTYDQSPGVTRIHDLPRGEQGRKRIEIPYIPPEQKPQPPPDDGRDPFYHQRMAYYKVHGVWATNEMLSR